MILINRHYLTNKFMSGLGYLAFRNLVKQSRYAIFFYISEAFLCLKKTTESDRCDFFLTAILDKQLQFLVGLGRISGLAGYPTGYLVNTGYWILKLSGYTISG